MAKSQSSVQELVSDIENGKIRLPEMQRRFVWKSSRIRDLLDSLYRGYPSGTILLWETTDEVPTQEFAVSQQENPLQTTLLLLDGQQRLTSLSAILRGEPLHVRGRRRPIDILFNLEHPDELEYVTEVDEEAGNDIDIAESEADASDYEIQARLNQMTFVVGTQKLASQPNWVSVTKVLQSDSDRPLLAHAGVTSLEDPRYDKYSERLKKLKGIRKYEYRTDILEQSMSYEEVTEIFVRVNSLGAKLRSSDLALAQITAKWPNSLSEFMAFQESCKGQGFDLDLGNHLRMLVAVATGQSKFTTIGSKPVQILKNGWIGAKQSTHFAINFLKSELNIDSPSLLSSPFLIISLGMYGETRNYNLSQDDTSTLRKWALLANAKGRYSRGSSETLLDQDLASIRRGTNAEALLDILRIQVGRLDVPLSELEGRNQRSALFKALFLAMRCSGARDWWTNMPISIDHTGAQHKLQFHHIFPKAKIKNRHESKAVNDIANLTFLEGKTNRKISAKDPIDYLPEIRDTKGVDALVLHCVPLDPQLWTIESFPDFLEERRRLIHSRLNAFLGD
jgi:hypothetical protein